MVKNIGLLTVLAVSMNSCVAKEQSSDSVATLLAERHSGYAYDPSRTVNQGQLQAIIKAGQSAPSSFNNQPWNFIVCDRTTNPAAYNKVFEALVEFNQNWVKNVPVLIVSVASTNSDRGAFNQWAQYDTGAAAFAMMLQATSLGLMAHQMSGLDAAKIAHNFDIPNDNVVMAVMAVGYEMPGQTRSVKKDRKPLSDNFFMGSWSGK